MSVIRTLSILRRPLLHSELVTRFHFPARAFHRSIAQNSPNSFFGSITQNSTTEATQAAQGPPASAEAKEDLALEESDNADEGGITYINPKDDAKLQKYLHPNPIVAIDELLTPLKKEIYLANVAKNGFFKNEDEVTLSNGKSYKLKLARDEIETLEPSLYLKSYRIKSSMKKATVVLRLLREMNVKTAITQCQFTTKKIAREASDLLRRGLKDAEKFGYDTSDLYIAQFWSGSDGGWMKRVEAKGRGRTGIITHRYIHIRCILKTSQTLKRLAWEKQVKFDALKNRRPLNNPIVNSPIRSKIQGYYKW